MVEHHVHQDFLVLLEVLDLFFSKLVICERCHGIRRFARPALWQRRDVQPVVGKLLSSVDDRANLVREDSTHLNVRYFWAYRYFDRAFRRVQHVKSAVKSIYSESGRAPPRELFLLQGYLHDFFRNGVLKAQNGRSLVSAHEVVAKLDV